MKNIKISYSPLNVPQTYTDELRAAFSLLDCNAEFLDGAKLKNPLRVFAYKQPRERGYVFLPYAALNSDINNSSKTIEILFYGRLSDPEKIKDAWLGLSGRIYKLCLGIAEILEGSRFDFDEAVDMVLQDIGCLSELPANSRVYLTDQINTFINALNGFNMLKALLDSGIKVMYCGQRSYCSLYKHPNLVTVKTPHPPKILVYSHPFIAYGASVVLLSAIAGGTVTATDANGFMNDNFPEMIFYDKNFTERIRHLLEHPAELSILGGITREKVLTNHMPYHRAKQILLGVQISGRNEVSLYEY